MLMIVLILELKKCAHIYIYNTLIYEDTQMGNYIYSARINNIYWTKSIHVTKILHI